MNTRYSDLKFKKISKKKDSAFAILVNDFDHLGSKMIVIDVDRDNAKVTNTVDIRVNGVTINNGTVKYDSAEIDVLMKFFANDYIVNDFNDEED